MNRQNSTYCQATWSVTRSGTLLAFPFTGKERDEETGYGYFGARYYDADLLTGWLSVDPMADKYPSLSPYHYCANNPVMRIDPTGEFDIETGTIERGDNLTKIAKQINEKYGTKLTIDDIQKANNIDDANKIQVGDKIALPGQNAEFNTSELFSSTI